jgi:hypothetical protein
MLPISHSPVAIRRSWTISSFESVAAARSPLMATAWTVAPRKYARHSGVDAFSCWQAVRVM